MYISPALNGGITPFASLQDKRQLKVVDAAATAAAAAKRKLGSDEEEDEVPGKRIKAGPSTDAAEPAGTAKNTDDDNDDDDFKPSRKRPAAEARVEEAASTEAASTEATPSFEPGAELGTSPGADALHLPVSPEFECEHGCGFDGNLEDVEAHEMVCSLRPIDAVDADGKPIKRLGYCVAVNCQEKLTAWDRRRK